MLFVGEVADVAPFVELLERAAEWMWARGVRQWVPGSMRAQAPTIERAQRRGELWVARNRGGLAGGLLLSAVPDPIWSDVPRAGAGYLSKLVIDREHVQPGFGAAVLADAERVARARGFAWLRLDCVATNDALVRYYQSFGYFPAGNVHAHAKGFARDLELLRHEKELVAVDFDHWHPDAHATLLFVRRAEEVLLIHKKRGHGAGKINGPGGGVEAGESPLEAAVRETREEVGIDVLDARAAAELRFHDPQQASLRGYVFVASRYRGTPAQSDEAIPFWCRCDALPYERMWHDDRIWLPRVLEGRRLVGDFLMSGEIVRAHRLQYVDALAF